MHPNVKIALFAGYKRYTIGTKDNYGLVESYWINTRTNNKLQKGFNIGSLPDYFSDLNAIHLVETYLSEKQKQRYFEGLVNKMGVEDVPFATAKDKAEVILTII